jgi:hypothetical protein
MAKAAFRKKKALFTSKFDLNLRKKALLCMVLKLGHFRKQIRNTWKVLKCGVLTDGEDQLDRLCKK